MSDVANDVKHQLFDGSVAEVLGWLVLVLRLQNVLHDEDDVLDKLSIRLIHDDLKNFVKILSNEWKAENCYSVFVFRLICYCL